MLFAKQYFCFRCEKGTKSTNSFTRHFNICIKEVAQIAPLPFYHKHYNNKKDILDGGLEEDLEDRSKLLDETNYSVRDVTNLLTKITP